MKLHYALVVMLYVIMKLLCTCCYTLDNYETDVPCSAPMAMPPLTFGSFSYNSAPAAMPQLTLSSFSYNSGTSFSYNSETFTDII